MTDFQISATQRRRLLDGHYGALKFGVKPSGCAIGARYVLAWAPRETRVFEYPDGAEPFVLHTPRRPVWFLTVTRVDRVGWNEEINWRVRFDVTDLRDRDEFLARGGGTQSGSDPLGAGRVPDLDWLDSEAEAISEFWEQARLDRVEGRERERAAFKRAKRAA